MQSTGASSADGAGIDHTRGITHFGEIAELEQIYRYAGIGLCVMNHEYRWVRINERLAEINGFPVEAHLGKSVFELLPELAPTVVPLLRQIIETGAPLLNLEITGETPARPGEQRVWLEHFLPLRNRVGVVVGVNIVCEEITERKRAENALRELTARYEEQTRRLEGILASIPDFFFILELDSSFAYANQRLLERWGRKLEEVSGLTMEALNATPEVQATMRAAIARVIRTGTPDLTVTASTDRVTGKLEYYEILFSPIFGADHTILQIACSSRNITERRRVEEALRESEARLTLALKVGQSGIFDWNIKENSNFWSDEILALYGLQRDQWGGTFESWHEIVVPEDRPNVDAAVALALREGTYSADFRIRRPDTGEVRWMHGRGQVLRDAAGQPERMLGVNMDVTDRRRIEEALRESEARFRTLADAMPQLAWIAQPDGWIYWYNQRWYEYTGTNLEQMQGWGWQRVHDPGTLPEVLQRFKAALESGEPFDMTFPLRGADGQFRPFLTRALPLKDEHGAIIEWFGTNTDVSEQKQIEEALRQSEERLRIARDELESRVRERTAELSLRAEQLRRLTSELTLTEQRERRRLAQILHDHLQQLLVGAKFGMELLQRRVDDHQRKTVEQVRGLIEESLATSRTLTVELSPPILHEAGLVAGLQWLTRWMQEKHGLTVHLDLATDAVAEREDLKLLLFQSVREALFNVVKHAGVNEAWLNLRHEPEGLRISVRDRGQGFVPESIHLRGTDATSGFGLFSIQERLAMLGGRAEVITQPGEGTEVLLLAPHLAPEEPISWQPFQRTTRLRSIETSAKSTTPAGKICVLLVDDHPVMREGIRMVLSEEPGIEIVGEAANGRQAIELTRRMNPDVIVMDISMPEMDGLEATRIIHEELPQIRIIGLSMFAEADRESAMLAAGASAYFTKSGDVTPLIEAVLQGCAN